MKIGILHLTDIHILDNCLDRKVELIVAASQYDVKEISNLYIVVSGDIVQYGGKEEFLKAKEFLDNLKAKIKPKNSLLQIHFIIVPGNHDCCFDNVKATRELILRNCNRDTIPEEDYFLDALPVQDNFWEFYKEFFSNVPPDKISYKREFQPHLNHKITFNCYNSSWMSEISEKCGSLIIPENKFLTNNNEDIIISVFHHPLNWLSPNTKRNNKSRFEEHLFDTSNIVLFGHEHDRGQAKNIVQRGNNVIFSEGKALQKDKENETGFTFLIVGLKDKMAEAKIFQWKEEQFILENIEKFELTSKEKRAFSLRADFEKKLNQLSIPLKHSKKDTLVLSDVFIYPDLEPLEKEEKVYQYPNSETLISKVKESDDLKILIEGEGQSGKTTLFYSLYKSLYESGYIPVYLRGKNINTTDVKDIVKKGLKEQYHFDDLGLFFQNERRVLFLDNIHKSTLNSKYKLNLIKNLNKHFDYILISVDSNLNVSLATEEVTTLRDYEKFKLLPLGHEKRGELIEQWFRLGLNRMTLDEERLVKDVKARLDEINSLLGNKLMPSHPIFILTLLQGLDTQVLSHDYSQTSYGHCYHALITAGLLREGLKDELNGYFNILKELAFFLYEKNIDIFTIKEFNVFYEDYKKVYYAEISPEKILGVFTHSNILKYDEECYCFSYKYIFFYLVALKVSINIEKHEKLIEDLCENTHIEKNANILIFLTHHTKAQVLIDNILFSSEIPFENVSPITLDKEDSFTEFISEFVKEVQHDVIEDRDPKHEIKKSLQRKDEIERKRQEKEEDSDDVLPPEAKEMSQAFRTIKILGQIVKNQKGDFEKGKLEDLVFSAYNTGFRFVGFFANLLEKDKDKLIEAISAELDEKNKEDREIDREEIKKTVLNFLQFISWKVCIDSFSHLMFSVGTKGRDELFETVSSKINSSAAKIVTFAIKSYYGSINVNELKVLFKEVEKNYLATSILRMYVRKHIYTNFVEKKKKDQIIKIAGFNQGSLNKDLLSKNNRLHLN
jgi:GTPase SAR1 family protein/predicted MPP superfamily phosphohydrolase